MQGVKQSLGDILKAKDQRVLFQKELLGKYESALVSYKLNIPGMIKYNSLIKQIFQEGVQAIIDTFKKENIDIIYKKTIYKNSGPELFICFSQEPEYVKKLCVEIEEKHGLGRLYDFDVLNKTGVQISRQDINKEPRKCLLCNKNAFECARSRTHSIESLLSEIENMANRYFKK